MSSIDPIDELLNGKPENRTSYDRGSYQVHFKEDGPYWIQAVVPIRRGKGVKIAYLLFSKEEAEQWSTILARMAQTMTPSNSDEANKDRMAAISVQGRKRKYVEEFERSIVALPVEEQVKQRSEFYEQFVTNDSRSE